MALRLCDLYMKSHMICAPRTFPLPRNIQFPSPSVIPLALPCPWPFPWPCSCHRVALHSALAMPLPFPSLALPFALPLPLAICPLGLPLVLPLPLVRCPLPAQLAYQLCLALLARLAPPCRVAFVFRGIRFGSWACSSYAGAQPIVLRARHRVCL